MEQLICHLFGDYILQSHWMATEKRKQNLAAAVHAITYGLPFLFLTLSPNALLVIVGTHFLLDRYGLARYVVYFKNLCLSPPNAVLCIDPADPEIKLGDEFLSVKEKYSWKECQATGYPSKTPDWLSVWLVIIADNTLHLLINYLALRFL
jgi:hypothetical protein